MRYPGGSGSEGHLTFARLWPLSAACTWQSSGLRAAGLATSLAASSSSVWRTQQTDCPERSAGVTVAATWRCWARVIGQTEVTTCLARYGNLSHMGWPVVSFCRMVMPVEDTPWTTAEQIHAAPACAARQHHEYHLSTLLARSLLHTATLCWPEADGQRQAPRDTERVVGAAEAAQGPHASCEHTMCWLIGVSWLPRSTA